MSILVTGGAGYIGSHVVHELIDDGRDCVVLDDLSTGVRRNVPEAATFVEGDAGDRELVRELIRAHDARAIIHFAGSTVVPESIEHPLDYYRNNTCAARRLMEVAVEEGVGSFVFSSTAAIYGKPDDLPVAEDAPEQPINPYGRSKLVVEWMLRDAARAHRGFEFAALRYFNVAGADPEGRTGHSKPTSTTLIKVTTEVALGLRDHLEIFGTDYPTRDGTCIRDYIHVTDLARAHLLALDDLDENRASRVLNCGYGRGYTVREVVDTVKQVSGVDFEVREGERRSGDPAVSIADASRLREVLDWEPSYDDLETIVQTGLEWEERERGTGNRERGAGNGE
ncbi:MAG: UDP-glucose 4-epimerase GalE [Bradymonadaceae bacterium]